MLAKASILVLCFANLFKSIYAPVNAPPFCKETDHAEEQLEHYYTTWYRISHFWRTSTLCRMSENQKKLCCAKVIKYCMGGSYEKIDLREIEKQIIDIKECTKEKIEMKAKDGEPWKKRKRMFSCPSQKICVDGVCYKPTKPILISAGGLINTALVFFRYKDEDLLVKPLYFIENLNFETIKSKLKTVEEQYPQTKKEPKEKPEDKPSADNKPTPEDKPAPEAKPTPKTE